MQFPSKLIEDAVNEIAKLPGIGKKTALRLVLHLIREERAETEKLSLALTELREKIRYCTRCHNISDGEICSICSSTRRDPSVICVVENVMDVMAIENTHQYQGLYHVLGGIISPIDGIGPEDLNIDNLIERVESSSPPVKEVIMAVSPTMEGDTTVFYITKRLSSLDLKVTTIARGVPVGGELEYTDEITLGRSILSRTEYDKDQLH